MIHREDPYGWGLSRIPMARDTHGSPEGSAGHPVYDTGRDLPWRLMGISLLLALLTLSGVIFLHRNRSEPLIEPEPQPVKIVVRISEAAPEPPPAPEKVTRMPTLPPAKPAQAEPVPEPSPASSTPETSTVEKPEPEPDMVPPPTPIAEKPQSPREPAPVAVQSPPSSEALPEATLPVPPPREDHQRRAQEPKLPEKTSRFARSEQPARVDEPVAPRTAERSAADAALPDGPTVSLGTRSRADVPSPAAGLSGSGMERNRPARPSSPVGSPVNVGAGGGEIDLPARTGSPAQGRGDDPRRRSTIRSTKAQFSAGAAVSLPDPGKGESSKPQATETKEISRSFERLDRGELDPSVAMSLSRLRTCRDPERETILKSRLSAMLGKSARCRSDGVVFDIRNAASAYSTHIEIYNYEGREFRDRCAALDVAIDACTARR